jgi:hypothetical protein
MALTLKEDLQPGVYKGVFVLKGLYELGVGHLGFGYFLRKPPQGEA